MSVNVSIPSAFRRHTEGLDHYECAGSDLSALLDSLGSRFPDLKPHLRDEQGNVRRFLNIYVNEEDIRFLGGTTYAFQDGDEILLVPSIAGGCVDDERRASAPVGGVAFSECRTTRRKIAAAAKVVASTT